MKKLYFVSTNAYDMLVSDDGEIRRVLVDNAACNLYSQRDRAEDFLREVEDDSSWTEYEETFDDLIDAECIVRAEIETNEL